MRKHLHIILVALLGLMVLAACGREDPDISGDARQVTEGPVKVSMVLSMNGFGGDNTLTKGEFYDKDNDFTEVDSLFFEHEKTVKDGAVYLFDAENAFEDVNGDNKLDFKPSDAPLLSSLSIDRIHSKIVFTLPRPCKSLAVVIVANYHTTYGSYDDMQALLDDVSASPVLYNPNQETYFTDGIPMHGFKLYGSLVGLSSGATDEQKALRQLKYYKGMATPLTETGFRTLSELERYAKEGTGEGMVRKSDCVQMEFALSRLHFRYLPAAGAIAADDLATGEIDSVRVSSVKLNVYKDKFKALPENWFTRPAVPTPYDNVSDAGDFVTGNIEFRKVMSKTGKTEGFVAYVPEIGKNSVTQAMIDANQEPSLVVEIKVKVRREDDGTVITYTYDRNTITVDDGIHTARTYTDYGSAGWVAWMKFCTLVDRKDKDDNSVPFNTRFSLVRNYSYEWVGMGVNE